jgi:NAD+ synthase (glutamine-hydrolysing)
MFKNSFVKLACINPVVEVGLPLENAKEIVNALKKSRASINLFPELATTGYSCGDLFHHEGLMKENYEAIDYIVKNNPSKGIVVFGAPLELTGSLFNCAIVIKEHEILGIIPKKHLSNHNEYSEKRWFQQGSDTTEDTIVVNVEFDTKIFDNTRLYNRNLKYEDEETSVVVSGYIPIVKISKKNINICARYRNNRSNIKILFE